MDEYEYKRMMTQSSPHQEQGSQQHKTPFAKHTPFHQALLRSKSKERKSPSKASRRQVETLLTRLEHEKSLNHSRSPSKNEASFIAQEIHQRAREEAERTVKSKRISGGVTADDSVSENRSFQIIQRLRGRSPELASENERLSAENEELRLELLRKTKNLEKSEEEADGLRQEVRRLEQKLRNMEVEMLAEQEGREQEKREQVESYLVKSARLEVQKQRGELIKECDERVAREREKCERMIEEKFRLNEELIHLQRQNSQLQGKLRRFEAALAARSDETARLQVELKMSEDVSKSKHVLETQLRETEEKNIILTQKLEELEQEESARSLRLGDLLTTRHDYVKMLKDKEERITSLENEVETLTVELGARRTLNRYERSVERASRSTLLATPTSLELLREENKKLVKDIELLAEGLLDQERKAKEAEQRASAYLLVIKEKEQAIDVLLHRRGGNRWYDATPDDSVDLALAAQLNSREEALPIKFIREGTGRYLFGKRRVTLHLEQDKVIVKTAGGFMTLEEFIEIYTVLEQQRESKLGAGAGVREKSPPSQLGSSAVRNFYNLAGYSNN